MVVSRLIVGEGPSASSDPSRPLAADTRTGRTIALFAGLSPRSYASRCAKADLTSKPNATEREMRLGAVMVLPAFEGRRVALLGRRVASAFGLGDHPFFRTFEHAGGIVTVVPHPSRRSAWWTEPENVARACEFWREFFREGPIS
jgi:hypothetical protein